MAKRSDRTDESTRRHEWTPEGVSRRGFLGSVGIGLGAAAFSTLGTAGRARQQATPTTIAEFQPPNLPENLAIDGEGTIYLSMAPVGEIHEVNTDDGSTTTVASIDVGDGLLLGLETDEAGTIYAAVSSSLQRTHGVWQVTPDGETERLSSLPAGETQPNGIVRGAFQNGDLLTADSLRGAIWRIPSGGGEAQVWLESPLLEPNPYASSAIGADGIAVGPGGDVWVDNLNYGAILRVPVDDGGSAGDPEVFVQNEALVGSDGLTTDDQGNLYAAVNAQNKVVRVTPDKNIRTLVSGGDLDFPAGVHFGTTGEDRRTLYIANFAYANFLAEDETPHPSLMSIEVGGAMGTTEATTQAGAAETAEIAETTETTER